MNIKHTRKTVPPWVWCWILPSLVLFSASAYGEEENDEDETEQRTSIGLDPRAAKYDNLGGTEAPKPLSISTSEEEWKFEFHGYLRAPLVLGFNNVDVTNEDGDVVGDDIVISSPARLSDSSYIRWNYTNNLMGPWTELKFSYGNARVTGNVSIAAYNLTDAGYRNLQTQLGIDQAFISLDFPRLFGERGGITWNVGGFSNRYGGMGRYDAGRYDTYIFGRTHIAGETLTANIDLSPRVVLQIEHGFGAKLNVVPSYTAIGDLPEWMPYGGRVPQLPALVNHGHLGLAIKGSKLTEQIQIAAHFMHEFTNSADQSTLENSDPSDDMKDSSLMTMGGEIKWHGGVLGEGYIGYSHLDAKDMIRMPNGIEVLHSFEGWNLMENYFGLNSEYYGTGTIDTIAFQYTFSMASVLWHPRKFWGQGPDLLLSLFGMFNSVNRDIDDELELEDGANYPSYAKQKLKWGGEAMYLPLSWFGMAFRYDLVQPNMADSTYSMSVLSPKLLFRTNFVTHEQVTLQYTHYIYGDSVTAEFPYYGQPPDPDAIMIMASMWW